jgi:toxin-antitoxin system PIN domain toxin
MSYLVDTNILVYASDENSPYHLQAKNFLQQCRDSQEMWCVTWVNIFEYLRVVTHPNVFRQPMNTDDAKENISRLLSLPQIEILSEERTFFEVYCELTEKVGSITGNLVHDAHIAALMLQHGITKIYTLDNQFRIFPFLEVLNPFHS